MVLELRPAHDPRKAYGFVGVVVSTADLSASVWLWERGADGQVSATKVIEIGAEAAEADQLPPVIQPFGAVPPLVTDIALSVDDRDLYVSCWILRRAWINTDGVWAAAFVMAGVITLFT
jgi:selenium-binding protein 1